MDAEIHVPPGFRFHPTEEELVGYYLKKKVASNGVEMAVIKDVDLYRIEPWDLHGIACKISMEQDEWYFFSHKDRKYPTGSRTNRATAAGFWKATGRDKPIHSKNALVGMRKTLVFYKGRAPNGQKSDFIMHEYRLETSEKAPVQEEGWVVCRVFTKRIPLKFQENDDQFSFPSDSSSPFTSYSQEEHPSRKVDTQLFQQHRRQGNFLQLPGDVTPESALRFSSFAIEGTHELGWQQQMHSLNRKSRSSLAHEAEELGDWRILDKFVASQLTQDDASEEQNRMLHASTSQEPVTDYLSTSTSSFLIDLWK